MMKKIRNQSEHLL